MTGRAILAFALIGLAFAPAAEAKADRLVVRGESTVVDAPCGPGVVCIKLQDATYRGTAGTGAYTGALRLKVADAFPNGEGGVCAPLDGKIVLGGRLVLGIEGESCQDGAGDPATSSFTGVARFTVKRGGRGGGIAVFSEDAADHDRMTLIGRLAR
jgi:hypothetical protein